MSHISAEAAPAVGRPPGCSYGELMCASGVRGPRGRGWATRVRQKLARVAMIRRFALLAAMAAVAASSACGGSGADRSQPVNTDPVAPATRPHRSRRCCARTHGVPSTVVSALRTKAQSPRDRSESVPRHASRQARRPRTPGRGACCLESVPPKRRRPPPGAGAGLLAGRRTATLAFVVERGLRLARLRRLSRGLSGSLSAPAHAGRKAAPARISSSSRPGRERCEQPAQRQGIPPPRWLGRPARWTQALLHAAPDRPHYVPAQRASAGVAVAALQDRLAALGYLPAWLRGPTHTTTARCRPSSPSRDGRDSPATASPARSPSPACARLRDRVRIVDGDPAHGAAQQQQVLLLVDGGAVEPAIHVSTAAPAGVNAASTFTIFRKEPTPWPVPFQVSMPHARCSSGKHAPRRSVPRCHLTSVTGCIRVPQGDSSWSSPPSARPSPSADAEASTPASAARPIVRALSRFLSQP